MKMRFWQKTYIFTLILFLICLNAGVFSLAYYTYRQSVKSTEDGCRSEQFYIAKSFERDYTDMNAAGEGANPMLLMQSYGVYYQKQQIGLDFLENGESVYSGAAVDYSAAVPGTIRYVKIGGQRQIVIADRVCEGKYTLVYVKSVADLDREFQSLMLTYALTAAGVSLFLAVCLYFILKKLSVPLERLRKTTETIAAGDYTVKAEERGQDEFAELAGSFNGMVDCINRQMEMLRQSAEQKQQLVDNLAHELRTPLTSIYGYAEYLRRTKTNEEDKIDCAICIMSESSRLQKISEKLLDTAYIRNNGIQKETVDLSALLADVAGKLRQKAEEKGVTIVCEGSGRAEGDETLLSMLFYNLTENAVKACDQGGRVTLSFDGNTAVVGDNGKGMTGEQLKHITEPFYRTDKSRSRAEGGAGLGLALCRQIAEAHGAEMSFESEVGKGTKVFVRFTTC